MARAKVNARSTAVQQARRAVRLMLSAAHVTAAWTQPRAKAKLGPSSWRARMTRDKRRSVATSALVMAIAAASATHAERHYDCTKPGNANKAACKAAAVAPPAPTSAAAASAAPSISTTTSARHYDCSKPGNANKAACKSAGAVAAAPAPPTAPAKPSIFSRIMKPKAQPASAPAPAAPAAAPTTTASSVPVSSYKGKSITTDAAGATGQCRDGTYTHATHHSGACSSHGGVAKWM